MIKPMLGKGPKTFDTVDMIAAFGLAFVFADDNVIATNLEKCIRMPVIRVIQTSGFGELGHNRNQFFLASRRYRKSQYLTVPLINAEDDVFSNSTPASFPRTLSTEHRLIHFKRSRENLQFLNLILVNRFSHDLVPSLDVFLDSKELENAIDMPVRQDRKTRVIVLSNMRRSLLLSNKFFLSSESVHSVYNASDPKEIPKNLDRRSEDIFSWLKTN